MVEGFELKKLHEIGGVYTTSNTQENPEEESSLLEENPGSQNKPEIPQYDFIKTCTKAKVIGNHLSLVYEMRSVIQTKIVHPLLVIQPQEKVYFREEILDLGALGYSVSAERSESFSTDATEENETTKNPSSESSLIKILKW